MPPLAYALFHGIALTLMVWLAALLFGVRDPIAFAALAAGCVAARVFESQTWMIMQDQMPALDAGKSIIFALFAAMVLPGFANVSRWACIAVAGLIAGQLARFGYPLNIFIWETLLVGTVAFFLAVGEQDTAHSS